nr:MAG TPA: hypothetical protein [Caudoviricetes sp.]
MMHYQMSSLKRINSMNLRTGLMLVYHRNQ